MDRKQYLIEQGLSTAEPYKQERLSALEQQYPDKKELNIINSYRVKKEKIFCHICGGKHHNNGFTGETNGKKLLLFGSTCATKYFDSEILKATQKNYQLRLDAANAKYNVELIKGTAKAINQWVSSNENIILSHANAWTKLFDENNEFIHEVFEHLDKNGNRLTREYIEQASGKSAITGKNESIVTREIIHAMREETGRRRLRDINDNYRLIRQFIAAMNNFDENTTTKEIQEFDNRLRSNFFDSVDNLYSAIKFSVEFFNKGTLEKIADWSDGERKFRLRYQENYKPRNLKKSLRRKFGYGYQMPFGNLRAIIGSEEFLLDAVDIESNKIIKHMA